MWSINTLRLCVLIIYMLIASGMDIKRKYISVNYIILGLILMSMLYIISPFKAISLILGIFVGLCLVAISIATKESIGIADGLILCVMGVGIGFQTLYVCLYSLIGISVFTTFLLIYKKSKRNFEIPMIPFYLISLLLQVFYNEGSM